MHKQVITSSGNPLIKLARSLHQKKARLESGLFLVEGIHHVGEASEAGWDVTSILFAPDLLTSNFAKDLLSRHSSESQPVSAQVMELLSGKENPQGIVAIVRQKETQFSDVASLKSFVALVSPQDPGNVGTILRTLDAVGVDALFMLDSQETAYGSVDLYHPTLIRASMGTIFWKPVIRASFERFIAWARKEGYQLIGTSARGDVDYRTLIPNPPWVVVLGNEQKGLSPAQLRACDVAVSMPMKGKVSSLNLAVAAGVLLYEFSEKT